MDNTTLIYILSGFSVLLLIWILIIEIRFRRIFAGAKAKNLEEMIITIGKKINQIIEKEKEINEHLIGVDNRLNKSIRSIETVRFNPFLDAGSNQSFAISFLNDEGDGVIISSLYARDRMSIFAKPIKGGKSEFELSLEEKEVLEKSIK